MTPPLTLSARGASSSGYWLNYAFAADPGSTWVQEVVTEVTCEAAEGAWLRFRSSYGEFFVLGADGGLGPAERPDCDHHAFEVVHDGWGRAALKDWLRGHEDQPLRSPVRLHVEKRFLLGRATLDGVELPSDVSELGAFGYLAEGPLAPPRLELEFCLEPSQQVELPLQRLSEGTGRFVDDLRWEACERFRFSYATLSGTLLEAVPYAPTSCERIAS
ncbi:MAG: hypothetical protein R3F62_21720 [Planctomycetota bacterium]